MSAILLKAAQKYIWPKAVGKAGRCWTTKEINVRLKKREGVRRREGTHIEAHESLNVEVFRLTIEVKRGIWQREVPEAKRMSDMRRVLKIITDNKPYNIRIITDTSRALTLIHHS